MIRHLVALRFKAGTSDATKQALYDDLAGLRGRIDGILDFQSHTNVSVEDPMVRGYRDLFWFDFRETAVRAALKLGHEAGADRLVHIIGQVRVPHGRIAEIEPEQIAVAAHHRILDADIGSAFEIQNAVGDKQLVIADTANRKV